MISKYISSTALSAC